LGCGIDGELTGLIKGETDRERGILELRRGSSRAAGVSQRERGKREESKERERDYRRYYTLRISLQHPNCCMLSQTKSNRTVWMGWEGRMCVSAEYAGFHSIKYSSLWDVLTGWLPNK